MADDDVHLFPNECYKYLFAIITNKCSFLSISLVCNPFFLVLPFLQPVNHSQSHNHLVVFHSQSVSQTNSSSSINMMTMKMRMMLRMMLKLMTMMGIICHIKINGVLKFKLTSILFIKNNIQIYCGIVVKWMFLFFFQKTQLFFSVYATSRLSVRPSVCLSSFIY